jgi:hypothetical protein
LKRLDDASLVERLQEDHVRLHPLVHDFARHMTPDAKQKDFREACAIRLARAYDDFERLAWRAETHGYQAVFSDLRVGFDLLHDPRSREFSFYKGSDVEYTFESLQIFADVVGKGRYDISRHRPENLPGFFLQQVRNHAFQQADSPFHPHKEAIVGALIKRAEDRLSDLAQPHVLLMRKVKSESGVSSVALTRDGRFAASAHADTSLRTWDVQSGEQVAVVQDEARRNSTWTYNRLKSEAFGVDGLSLTPDGRRVMFITQGNLRVWNRNFGLWRFGLGSALSTLQNNCFRAMLFPDGRSVVTVGPDKTVQILSLASGGVLRSFSPTKFECEGIPDLITTDGRHLVFFSRRSEGDSAQEPLLISDFDLESGHLQRRQVDIDMRLSRLLALTPDGRRAASKSIDHPGATLWNLETGHKLCYLGDAGRVQGFGERAMVLHEEFIDHLIFTDDGRLVVTVGKTGFAPPTYALKLWDVDRGVCIALTPLEDLIPGDHIFYKMHGWACLAATPAGDMVLVGDKAGNLLTFRLVLPAR